MLLQAKKVRESAEICSSLPAVSDDNMHMELGNWCKSTGKTGLPVLYRLVNELERQALDFPDLQLGLCGETVERWGRRTADHCLRTKLHLLRKNYVPADDLASRLIKRKIRLQAFDDGLDTGRVDHATHSAVLLSTTTPVTFVSVMPSTTLTPTVYIACAARCVRLLWCVNRKRVLIWIQNSTLMPTHMMMLRYV